MRRVLFLSLALASLAFILTIDSILAVTYEPGPAIVAKAVGSLDLTNWSTVVYVGVGGTVHFADNLSFDTDTANDPWAVSDTLNSWSWDFGDGNTGSGQTTSHVYNAVGDYLVRLTIDDLPKYADDQPSTSTSSDSVQVHVLDVVISLSVAPTSIPRDTISEATATATVTIGGSPAAGKAVNFSIVSGPGVVTIVNGTTDSNGHATAKVKSSDIVEGTS